jgi:hypothetical protein
VDRQAIEQLKRRYTGMCVLVESDRGVLRRWKGVPGRIKTISAAGLALVQFEGADEAWHPIELSCLKPQTPEELV